MLDLLRTRRSIRRYRDKPIEQEKIDTLIKAALLSPSSRSKRPWEFITVTEPSLIKDLAKSKEHGSKFVELAPLCFVVIADRECCDVWIEDASIASAILHLTAHSMDLGSCWVQIRERNHSEDISSEDYVRNLLNIPDNYAVEAIITVGYPDETKKAYTDEDLLYNKFHHNTYTN
ncbi:MAG: nitroreductase family protein [Clostridium sp.]|uniref:nitroreductase family protein n=1 Tax=Clostridium sp. TaxID=1506 RepID=UPI002FC8D2C2